MPRKKHSETPKPLHLRFDIRNSPKQSPSDYHRPFISLIPVDHLAVLRPADIKQVAPDFVSDTCGSEYGGGYTSPEGVMTPIDGPKPHPICALTINISPGARADIRPVVAAVIDRLTPDADIHIEGAYITSDLLDQILSKWADVNFSACTFGKNWWRIPKQSRNCNRLWIENCTIYSPPELEVGCSAWPELKWITIDEGYWHPELHGNAFSPPELPSPKPSYSYRTTEIVRAFYNSNLTDLSVFNCKDLDIISQLPSSPALNDVWVDGSPTGDPEFAWITNHHSLESLSLSWRSDFPVPWMKLQKLKKLRSLRVINTPFSDSDLAEVARFTKLRCIEAYYSTRLTSACWSIVFRMKSLKQIWVSADPLEGPFPTDLPTETNLNEVVGLNVGTEHMKYLRLLLEPYPEVKTFEM